MSTDYSVFGPFLRVDTWASGHDEDYKRFYLCLSQVVESDDFNPDQMGKYFRSEKRIDSGDDPYASRVDDLVTKAWAVRDYLRITGETSAYEDPDVLV